MKVFTYCDTNKRVKIMETPEVKMSKCAHFDCDEMNDMEIRQVVRFLGCIRIAEYRVTHNGHRYKMATHYFNKSGLEIAYRSHDLNILNILPEPRQWDTWLLNHHDHTWSYLNLWTDKHGQTFSHPECAKVVS